MKKLFITLFPLCFLILCSCGSNEQISGTVTEIIEDSEALSFSFVLTTDKGERYLVSKTPDTSVFSLTDGFDSADFCSGNFLELSVDVRPASFIKTRDAGGERLRCFKAESIVISGFLSPEGYALSDGSMLEVRQRFDSTVYSLENGVELLSVQNGAGPEHSYVEGMYSLDDLSDEARDRIAEYYRAQGLMYDVEAELESAYARYRNAEVPWFFQGGQIYQFSAPVASNDYCIFFVTHLTLPGDGTQSNIINIGAVFDRQTGEHIPNAALFTCTAEELIGRLLDISGSNDTGQRANMIRAFDVNNVVFYPDALEISFPIGTLPGEEYSSFFAFDYSQELLSLIQPRAVPDSPERP